MSQSALPSIAFFWADKAVTRRIREQIPDVASALAVYHALAELASDNQAETFTATQAAIASKSGFKIRTVGSRLADLVRIRVIEMQVPEIRSAARFTLLDASGNGCRAIGNKRGAIRDRPPASVAESILREESRINGRPLGTAERIGLEKQSECIGAELKRLKPLRLYQRPEGWAQKIADLEARKNAINTRLSDGANFTAR